MNEIELCDNSHKNYSWVSDPEDEFLSFMARHYWSGQKLQFLDLGVGSSSAWLAHHNFDVTAVEGDVLNIDFKSETFDCILAIGILECLTLEQAQALFKRVRRWIKPTGRLFGTVLADPIPKPLVKGTTYTKIYKVAELQSILEGFHFGLKLKTNYVSDLLLPVNIYIFDTYPISLRSTTK